MSAPTAKIIVFGFDVGHGESAVVALEDAFSTRGPKGLHPETIFRSQPTVLATLMDGRTLWGNDAIIHPQVRQNQVSEFDVCFKEKPGCKHIDAVIQRFARTVHDAVTDKFNGQSEGQIQWFIGCPSAWDANVRETYRDLFERAGFQSVAVVKESRAAFSYYFEMTNESIVGDVKKPTIVLDFGSSTLDATLAIGLRDEELDPGIPLGASWIDKAILEWNLRHCSEDDFPAGKQDGVRIAQQLAENRIAYNAILLQVRAAKERYFNAADGCYTRSDHLEQIVRKGDLKLRIALYDEMMHEIMNTPLESLLPELMTDGVPDYIRHELVGYSWLGRCRKFLEKISSQLKDHDLTRLSVGHVLLTGGASRMREVRQLVMEYFDDNDLVRVVQDQEPEMCIARGLACWGRTAVQTASFEKEAIALLLDDKMLWNLIETQCTLAGLHTITSGKWAEIMLSWLRIWRKGYIPHTLIGSHTANEMRQWSASGNLDTVVKECVTKVERGIREQINNKVKDLLKRYQIAPVTFLSETALFEGLSDYFKYDWEACAAVLEEGSPFEDLRDGWLGRKLLIWDDHIKEFVESARTKWREADVQNLYREKQSKDVLIGLIEKPIRDSIEKAITATQWLLTTDIETKSAS